MNQPMAGNPTTGVRDYVAHMLYCYSVQDDGKDGLRWLAMTPKQRKPWLAKATKRIREWRAVERACASRAETWISFKPSAETQGVSDG